MMGSPLMEDWDERFPKEPHNKPHIHLRKMSNDLWHWGVGTGTVLTIGYRWTEGVAVTRTAAMIVARRTLLNYGVLPSEMPGS